jgi:hypothetical protein
MRNRLNQTSQTGGQWYSDSYPLVFPGVDHGQGLNVGQVFNSRSDRLYAITLMFLLSKTAELKIENLAQTTFRLSTIRHCAPRVQ